MEKELYSMLEVSGTMLITLYARARESKSHNPIISDSKAVEMIPPSSSAGPPSLD